MGEVGSSAFGAVALSAVLSAVVTQVISGRTCIPYSSAFRFSGIGVAALPRSWSPHRTSHRLLYVQFIYVAHDLFHHWHMPRWTKTMVAGLVVGIVGIVLPQIFGVGYTTIGSILNGAHFSLTLLFLPVLQIDPHPGWHRRWLLWQRLCTILFLGATFGFAYGQVTATLLPAWELRRTFASSWHGKCSGWDSPGATYGGDIAL
ncbi:MAG: hypothetical protein R2867_42545 [Caldilineaceae bacterium]